MSHGNTKGGLQVVLADSDYSHFPDAPYFLDLKNISNKGASAMLEVPVSVLRSRRFRLVDKITSEFAFRNSLFAKVNSKIFPVHVNRPNGRNLKELLTILERALENRLGYVEFMLHSSELMPGGSPAFPTSQTIDKLYSDIETHFRIAQKSFQGQTMFEFYETFSASRK